MDHRDTFRAMHPFTKLLMLVMLMFVSLIVVMGLGTFAAIPFLGEGVLDFFATGDSNPGNVIMMRYFQVLSHVGLFIVPSIAFALIVSKHPSRYLSLKGNPGIWPMVLGALIMFAAVPMVTWSYEINHLVHFPDALKSLETWMRGMESTAEQMTRYFLKVDGWQGLLFNVFMIALIPAIGEEFIFRGIIQKLFAQWTRNQHVAVLITSVLFSAMHLQFFSFLPRFALGVILGYMLVWSGNIWIPMLAHFVNNLTALLVFFYFDRGIISFDMDDIGEGTMAPVYAIASLAVIVALFVAFRRINQSNQPIANSQ